MADNEGDENLVVLPSTTLLFDSETPRSEYSCDENTPLSPGEVRTMRNHPKVASVLFSPSRRTTRGGEGKIKPKSFSTSLYASPTRKTKPSGVEKEKRKTLQVLQPTASGDGTLVGSRVVTRHHVMKSKSKTSSSKLKQQKLKIPSIPGSSSSNTCTESSDSDSAASSVKKNTKSLQDEVIDDAVALMVSDPPPERYWELLAEERRLALQESLEENERLHKEMEELKERNKTLEEVAGQAEYFASLYQMVMEGEVPDDTESSDATEEESVAASLQLEKREDRVN
ncbi:hypothetical protein OS493_003935 [Desmophyllum pertusum]|uniref:Geminin n=1 Tax=Desmophyllum pertusum TaxID=174260 RepID=A0A9W9ZS78_9CNID|nr:hypothetical protein OS493_003935 [Desmophyllum pertusum]